MQGSLKSAFASEVTSAFVIIITVTVGEMTVEYDTDGTDEDNNVVHANLRPLRRTEQKMCEVPKLANLEVLGALVTALSNSGVSMSHVYVGLSSSYVGDVSVGFESNAVLDDTNGACES